MKGSHVRNVVRLRKDAINPRRKRRPPLGQSSKRGPLLRRTTRWPSLERLEPREMLALASPPNHLFDLSTAAVSVQLGLIDDDTRNDLITLESNGDVTVGLNNGDNTWREVKTSNLAITNASGMALGRVNSDPYLDLIVQGANEVVVA